MRYRQKLEEALQEAMEAWEFSYGTWLWDGSEGWWEKDGFLTGPSNLTPQSLCKNDARPVGLVHPDLKVARGL